MTAIAVLVPATAAAAQAEPPDPPRPVEMQLLWPTCVTVLGWTACIPP